MVPRPRISVSDSMGGCYMIVCGAGIRSAGISACILTTPKAGKGAAASLTACATFPFEFRSGSIDRAFRSDYTSFAIGGFGDEERKTTFPQMSICVSVKVSEGLVLAADSTAAIMGRVGPMPAEAGILKTYDHVRKLSHIKDYPIGTLTWGAALIGARSVESLVREYEYGLPSLGEEEEKLKEHRMRNEAERAEEAAYKYSVKQIAGGLLDHVSGYYEAEFADQPPEERPPLGILVSGYSSGRFFPEQWLIQFPAPTELTEVRPDVDGKPDFGSNWFGLTDAIIRLHWGRDDSALGILAEHFNVTPEEVGRLLERLQYVVLFDGMPLQDAIDYAVYLVNVVIGRFRFVVGAPLCGGEIDVAVITPDSFTWIQRKSWNVNGRTVR